MRNIIRRLWKDEEGPTAVEYALMLVLVSLAIAGALPALSDAVTLVYTNMATALAG